MPPVSKELYDDWEPTRQAEERWLRALRGTPEPGRAVILIVGSHPASAVDVTADIRALLECESWEDVTEAEGRLRRLLG